MEQILELIRDLISALNRCAAALEQRGQEPEPEPTPVEPEPEPTPEPEPEPEPAPQQPAQLPEGYRAVQDFKIDRELTYNWGSKAGFNIFLPSWRGGDQRNGVGGSLGTPEFISYNDDGSVTLEARMAKSTEERDGAMVEVDRWRMGALQLNRPTFAKGKWGAIVTSHTDHAVNAFYAHEDDGKELDFELVERDGVIGWAPAVHMPQADGSGRVSSSKRTMALGKFEVGVAQRLEFELFDDRCEFSIDGEVFETIRPSDMADGGVWDTSKKMATFATIERHRDWAGDRRYDLDSAMTVHAFALPG